MGSLNTPEYMQLNADTSALGELEYDDFDALVVGGQSPMFAFREREVLKNALRTLCEAGKVMSARSATGRRVDRRHPLGRLPIRSPATGHRLRSPLLDESAEMLGLGTLDAIVHASRGAALRDERCWLRLRIDVETRRGLRGEKGDGR